MSFHFSGVETKRKIKDDSCRLTRVNLYKEKNSKNWWITYSKDGRRVKRSTRTPLKSRAEEIADKIEREVILGIQQPSNGIMLLDDFGKRFFAEINTLKAQKTQETNRTAWNILSEFMIHRHCTPRMRHITRDTAEKFIRGIEQSLSTSSARIKMNTATSFQMEKPVKNSVSL